MVKAIIWVLPGPNFVIKGQKNTYFESLALGITGQNVEQILPALY